MEFRYLFIFQEKAHPWWLGFLKKKYEHVCLATDCWPRDLYRFHGWNNATITTRVGEASKLPALLLELRPTEVVEYWGRVRNIGRHRYGPMSCVELSKHIASLSTRFVVTPWQLRNWLLKNGGQVLEHPYD